MSRINTPLLLQGGLYLLVASIPFEYPERSIPLEIPTLTGAVFLLGTLFYPRRCYGRVPAAVVWFAVYLIAFLLSMIASGGDFAAPAISEFVVVLQGILVLLAAGNLMQDERVATRALATLVGACVLDGTHAGGLADAIGGHVAGHILHGVVDTEALPFVGFARTTSAVWTGGERVSALGQNANSAAMILAAGLIALIGLAYEQRGSRSRLILTGLLGALLGFAVLETGSRGGLASLVGGVLVFALAADTLRTRLRNAVIAALAIALLILGILHLPVIKNRLEDSMKTGNMAGREQLYPALWTMFLEKPALGWGPVANTYELAARIGERERPLRAARNIVLELVTATGIIGAIPFLLGGWLCVRAAWRSRRGPHGVLPLALFCSVLISNMSGDWIAAKLIWVVLAGAGDKAFCVGGDLKERQGMTDEVWRAQHVIFEAGAARVLHCPVPVIAAVEGFAMGGGCELAVLSDFIVASETAVFAVPEVTLGIFPGIGGTQLLPRIIGGPLAKEMIFTGRRIAAPEAKAIGLVNHLVPAGQARAKALEIAATIAANGPVAVRQAKKAINWGGETDLETGMALAIEAYNVTVVTEDRMEGVRAFNEKRKPRFQGK